MLIPNHLCISYKLTHKIEQTYRMEGEKAISRFGQTEMTTTRRTDDPCVFFTLW